MNPDENPPAFPALTTPSPRTVRRRWRGWLKRWLWRSWVLVPIGFIAWQLVPSQRTPKTASLPPETPPASVRSNSNNAAATSSDATPSRLSFNSYWERGVVTVESTTPGETERQVHGSGVLLTSSPLVVTSLHVAKNCLQGSIRLWDGTAYEIIGYAAFDEAHDLALLAIRDAPRNLPGLELATEPTAARQPVWAIGHPHGLEFSVSAGQASRVVTTGELPISARKFLEQMHEPFGQTRWIQHSAALSPGNSGGPLLNATGQLLGINTWVDLTTHYSFAVHVDYVRVMLDQPLQNPPIKLEQLAYPQLRMEQELWRLSPQRVREIVARLKDRGWRPTRREEYHDWQRLAFLMSAATLPDFKATRRPNVLPSESLTPAVDQALRELKTVPWNDPLFITLANEWGVDEIRRPNAALLFFVTIDRLVEGPDGSRALLAKPAGLDTPVLISLATHQLTTPVAGSQCVVLGVNDNGRLVKYGDNPLDLITAPVVRAAFIQDIDVK